MPISNITALAVNSYYRLRTGKNINIFIHIDHKFECSIYVPKQKNRIRPLNRELLLDQKLQNTEANHAKII